MTIGKAKRQADKIATITGSKQMVVRFKIPFYLWAISSWFWFTKYMNVSEGYLVSRKMKVYYTTKELNYG